MNVDVMGAVDRLSKAWQTSPGLITESVTLLHSNNVLIKLDLCMSLKSEQFKYIVHSVHFPSMGLFLNKMLMPFDH